MRRKIISAIASIAIAASAFSGFSISASAANVPQYRDNVRLMEKLNRGLVAIVNDNADNDLNGITNGVYLSWRLLGTESLADQAFEIYRSPSQNGGYSKLQGVLITGATNYTDTSGTATNWYKVVPKGATAKVIKNETAVKPFSVTNKVARASLVKAGTSLPNSYSYVDIPIERPEDIQRAGDGKTSKYYSYDSSHEGGANDGSIGDLDGDGDYEIVLKWDPTDSKDSAGADFTGRVYLDGYQLDPNNGGKMWRIDLGQNITAGPHYSQFIVYDFNGDGKAEIACQTAPGTIDGTGRYVTEVGDTEAIRKADNKALNIGMSDKSKGKNMGPEYYTIFDGETGEALATTDAIPLVSSGYWGDSKYNRAERFLAGVAYLDGVHPSLIECRGYYARVMIRAYSWDGESFTMQWEYNSGDKKTASSMYGQGNHNLSIADVDNDGKDEIVYGSATLDDDGKTVLGNTLLGHGDAIHTSDFNNDGTQETFSVKEDSPYFKQYGEDLRVTATGEHFWASGKLAAGSDNGRGVMTNADDNYAKTHPEALSIGWSSGFDNAHNLNGDDIAAKPKTNSRGMDNFLVYWDGDLGRELLDDNQIAKYYAQTGSTGRFYSDGDGFIPGTSNNFTKRTPTLVADIWGDWREEIVLPINKGSNAENDAYLRVFTTSIPTEYRLTTLMHDSQYRTNVAIQNVGYNQPPHTSYYIGSAALATDDAGNTLKYLAPKTPFTNVTTEFKEVPVTGVSLSETDVVLEKPQTKAISAILEPLNATTRGVTWTSSDPNVVTVSNGILTAVNNGNATVTVTTKDGNFTATCNVTVWSIPVEGISLSDSTLRLGSGTTKKLTATVIPNNATVKTVQWTSSAPTVASVDEDGNIEGLDAGVATITATALDGGYSASCKVIVTPMEIIDITGDNVFVTDEVKTGTTYSDVTATSATITHLEATEGTYAYKTFEKITDNHAVLKFHYVTGGQKIDGSNWNWTGHEYSMSVELLDENDNNILTLTQPYATSAGALTSKLTSDGVQNFANDWATVVDGLGNIQGSAKRWIVEVEFDYDNHMAFATITGTDDKWEAVKGQYTREFDIGDLKFGKLRFSTTLDGSGTIIASPQMSNVSYKKHIPMDIMPIVSDSFNVASQRLIFLNITETAPYTDLAGVTLYIGTRSRGSHAETNFSIESGGKSGNALVMNSSQFTNSNRGPRFKINTPDTLDDGVTYTATIYAKPVNGSGGDAKLYYNDSTTTQATNELPVVADQWNKLTVTLKKSGSNTERVIYVDDVAVASDNAAQFPVFWGTEVENTSAKVYFDDLMVISDAKEAEPELSVNATISGNALKADITNTTGEDVPVITIIASYDKNGKLVETKLTTYTVTAGNTIVTTKALTNTGNAVRGYVWDRNTQKLLCPVVR